MVRPSVPTVAVCAHVNVCLYMYRSGSDNQPLVARALYDFTAERTNELSFSVGDELVCTLVIRIQ